MRSGQVLIVDDDDALRETLAEALEYEGFTVQTAADGASALFTVLHSSPDLVLVDMRMPLLDGASFVRELRNRGVAAPILVMTASQDASMYAAEIRADGWVGKPFSLDEILPAIERLSSRVA
jgi:two-component system response regulator MprA